MRKGSVAVVSYLELSNDNLVLRPISQAFPIDLIPIAPGKAVTDYILVRVCYVGIET